MRNSSEIWCETAGVSLELINDKANREFNNGNMPTMVYISIDLLAVLQKGMDNQMRHSGFSIMTVAGSLNVSVVKRLKNFLLVGRKEDLDMLQHAGVDRMFWNDEEHDRITKAFEDIIILEGEE